MHDLEADQPADEQDPRAKGSGLHDLHHHIDAMIETNAAIPVSEVWERLVDEHGASASYGAIRAYIARHPGRG